MSTITNVADITAVENDVTYTTAAVSRKLGVQASTLRKYCALMQKHGYEFGKNSVGHRVFYKKDIDVMTEIVRSKNYGNLTLEQSVVSILDIDDVSATDVSDMGDMISEFASFKRDQMAFNEKLIEQLQAQQDYIKNSLEERDRRLLGAIKESMVSKNKLAIAIEEVQKKRPWWKFF